MGDKPADTDEYLAALTSEQRAVMEQLREAIRAAAPGAEEGFSYGMPMFRLHGKPLVWYAAWRKHYSLYPIGEAMATAHAGEDERFEVSKGTIRFPASHPLPLAVVRKLVEALAAEAREAGR
jgi:uncharacterized protein YdhG (YjbR/CyaY superfamily)